MFSLCAAQAGFDVWAVGKSDFQRGAQAMLWDGPILAKGLRWQLPEPTVPEATATQSSKRYHDDIMPGGAILGMVERPLRRAFHTSSSSSWRLPAQDFTLCSSALGKAPIHSSLHQKYLALCSALKAWKWGSSCSAKVHADDNAVKPADGWHHVVTTAVDNLAGSGGGYQP